MKETQQNLRTIVYGNGLVEVSLDGQYEKVLITGRGEGTTVHTATLAAIDNYNRIKERVEQEYDKPFRKLTLIELLLMKRNP